MEDTPKENLTKVENFSTVKAREVDFVTRFTKNWDALREIMGIMRPIRKAPGTVLKSYEASIVLQSGDIEEGEEIPYSQASVKQLAYADLNIRKWSKAVSIESVNQYGAEIAVQRTDEAFLNELQNGVLSEFYAFLKTGTLNLSESDFQMAIAMAIGSVIDKFKKLRRDVTNIILFVNTLDAYRYLGAAEISVQTTNGLTYLRNFMGASTTILSSEIEQGTVIAVPADNIVLYYIDPGDSNFAQLGLNYTVQGETNLLGFHANGNYSTAVGESFAIMGMKLWAEYLDGIAVVKVDDTPTLGKLTITMGAGKDATHTKITSVEPTKEAPGNVYKYKTASETAPTVTYGQNLRTWKTWDGSPDTEIECASGDKITVVEVDSDYKAQNSGESTVSVGS